MGVFFDGSMKRHHSIGGGQGEGQSPMIVLANRGTKSTSHQRHVVTARSANVLAGIDTNRSATGGKTANERTTTATSSRCTG
ncbi:hypothetical protein AB0G02_31580, partial [Actinosynnema sp. NPDC023658]|uniref:hypothetical protein n=1 Tax=Actinosynnema sp. NPDC023658 TaxID=3155465 RepID=UPI0033FD51A7